jgi:hypothetical protein
MATGRLGAKDLSATTNTEVYTVPDETVANRVIVSVCNRNASTINIRLAIIDGAIGDIANEDYIEYDTEILANGVLERGEIILQANQTIGAYSDTANVSVVVYGHEVRGQLLV